MSRYDLTARDDAHTVAAGWDGPLDTFFVHVFKKDIPDDEPESPVFAVGECHGHCQDVDDFLRVVDQHALVPDSFRDQLVGDRAHAPHDPHSPGAKFLRALEAARQRQQP